MSIRTVLGASSLAIAAVAASASAAGAAEASTPDTLAEGHCTTLTGAIRIRLSLPTALGRDGALRDVRRCPSRTRVQLPTLKRTADQAFHRAGHMGIDAANC